MCTAIFHKTSSGSFFGRNLDVERDYGEKICITPRNYNLLMRNGSNFENNYAMIGMGLVIDKFPLYFDATNEFGLSAAGLNFPGTARYNPEKEGKLNIASFEVIPYFLARFKTVDEICEIAENINICDASFNRELSPTPLHWLIADKDKCICMEQTERGLSVYENPCGVLTNNPGFDIQLFNLNNYLSLSAEEPENHFSKALPLESFSRGMGALRLPGDFSSQSRFVRACFVKFNMQFSGEYDDDINSFFNILDSVRQYRGCVKVGDEYEYTDYSSSCDMINGIYRYTTYTKRIISTVDMHRENLSQDRIIVYDIERETKL